MKSFQKSSPLTIILISLLIAVSIVCIILLYPSRKKFVMTPSTHQNISYLQYDSNQLNGNKLKFALYDSECQSYEFCFAEQETVSNDIFNSLHEIQIEMDGKEIAQHSIIIHHYLGKRYFIMLIEDIPYAGKIQLQNGNDRIILQAET